MFNMLIYKLSSCKYLRWLLAFVFVLSLSGCDNKAGMDSTGEEVNYEAHADCWQTRIISAVLRIINTLYDRSVNYVVGVTDGGTAVIFIAFSIWMAFRVLKTLSSFKEENLGEVWTEIGQKLFVCAFCAYLVYNSANVDWAMKTFVLPVYNTILELGLRILETVAPSDGQTIGEYGEVTYVYNYSACEIPKDDDNVLNLKEMITPMANCLVCTISDRLNIGAKIGLNLIYELKFSTIFVGLFLLLLFLVAKFSFILFIIDGLFRLNFAVFLMPILIICIPFNFTRKWSSHCFSMFINSSGIMLFMGLLSVIATASLEIIINATDERFDTENIEGLGPALLSILFIAFMLVNIPGLAVALADKFIGGGGSDAFQKKVTKFVVSTAKKLGEAALSSVTSGASKAITQTLEKYEASREALETAKDLKQNISSALSSAAGYNDD